MKKNGFTLIELLVVIAIIGLLLAIITPALSKAKMYAEEVICKSNLKQYANATEIYSMDNKERFPNPWESLYGTTQFAGEVQRFCRFHNPEFDLDANCDKEDSNHRKYAGPYWPYLATSKVSVCPTFTRFAKKYGAYHQNHDTSIPVANKMNFGYSMNAEFAPTYVNNSPVWKKKSSVKSSPSRIFLWAEENMWRLQTRNSSGTLVTLSNYVLNDNALLVGTSTAPVDCFGSFHKVSLNQFALQLPVGGTDIGEYKKAGLVNVLMLDGSVMFVSPLDTINYKGVIK